jgi:hypothetical protein
MMTVEELEQAAVEKGITVRRTSIPLCVHGGEVMAVSPVRVIDPLDLLDDWNFDNTLILYKIYMRPADELITVRYAEGIGPPRPEDV